METVIMMALKHIVLPLMKIGAERLVEKAKETASPVDDVLAGAFLTVTEALKSEDIVALIAKKKE